MKFLSDQELYSNVTPDGTVDFTPYQQAVGDRLSEYESIDWDHEQMIVKTQAGYLSNQLNVEMWKTYSAEDLMERGVEREAEMSPQEAGRRYVNKMLDFVEEHYQMDHIGGFLTGHGTIADREVDYFDSHPLGRDSDSVRCCGGAFKELRDILNSFFLPNYCFGCLLMSVFCFFVLTQNLDGYFGFFAGAVMVLTPVVFLLSELGEDGICKIVCNVLVKVAVLVVSVLGVISRMSSPVPEIVLVLRYYYMIAVVAQLIDIVIKYFKTMANGKKKKEYRCAYEQYAPQIHRYIRYHVLWWNTQHPGEPLHESIKRMQNEFDYLARRYKKG